MTPHSLTTGSDRALGDRTGPTSITEASGPDRTENVRAATWVQKLLRLRTRSVIPREPENDEAEERPTLPSRREAVRRWLRENPE